MTLIEINIPSLITRLTMRNSGSHNHDTNMRHVTLPHNLSPGMRLTLHTLFRCVTIANNPPKGVQISAQVNAVLGFPKTELITNILRPGIPTQRQAISHGE